jgi:hypothetical protein
MILFGVFIGLAFYPLNFSIPLPEAITAEYPQGKLIVDVDRIGDSIANVVDTLEISEESQ